MKKKITFFFSIFLLISKTAIFAQANMHDSLALVDLYDSTGATNWKHHTNWLTKKPLSTWLGVTVDNTGHVTQLSLSDNNLTGAIPSSFGHLSALNYIYFNTNSITSLPSTFGSLSSLQTLYLANNSLSSLPNSFGNLPALQVAYLNNNLLESLPSTFGNLSQLTYLVLESNHISSLPNSIGNLSNITSLGLSYNSLQTLPNSIGNLPKLSELDVLYNQLTSLPNNFGNIKTLQTFYADHNQLSNLPSSFNNLSNLSTVSLSYNNLSGKMPDLFKKSVDSNLTGFTQINIQYNKYDFDAGVHIIKQLKTVLAINPQQLVNINQNGNTLSVSAGGNVSDNTYNWIISGGGATVITGDSTFTPSVNGTYYVVVTNKFGTGSNYGLYVQSDSVTYSSAKLLTTNSLQSKNADASSDKFSIYPSPAKSIVNIDLSNIQLHTGVLQIMNTDGKIITQKNFDAGKSNLSIDVSSYAKGIYFVVIKTKDETLNKKFVKE